MNIQSISSIRKDYALKKLNENEVEYNPIDQFSIWFEEALKAKVYEPNAMVLATSTLDGRPSARVVLLKQFDHTGFNFFTNYNSRKALNIEQNPYASIVFFWSELERQVRVEGVVNKIDGTESDSYFNSRPEGSKVAAWISQQSQVIPSREHLESLESNYQKKLSGKPINRPSNWGGYSLRPFLIEFWQGRPNRLHDRIQYRQINDKWVIERLAP